MPASSNPDDPQPQPGQLPAYRDVVTDPMSEAPIPDIIESRRLFPATEGRAYFNTAAVGLASRQLAQTYHAFIDEWATRGLDYGQGERAANDARSAVARLIGADATDLALIPSVSSAAGLVAAQFGAALRGDNVVIGEREYSSNHFPWRQLAVKGYDVRQVPFRRGGLDPDDVGRRVDAGTRLVAFSGVQSATGHRSDIAAISRVPFASFFGPEMDLSSTASRFDSSISWLAAIGNRAALRVFDDFGPDVVYARNRELETKLRVALARVGWDAVDLPEENRSTIVSVGLGDAEPSRLVSALSDEGIVCSARDGALRLSIHFYNHEDDIERLATALASSNGRFVR